MPANIGVCSQVELRREWEFLIKDTEAPGPGAIPHPAASQASGAQLGTAGFLSEDSPQGHKGLRHRQQHLWHCVLPLPGLL